MPSVSQAELARMLGVTKPYINKLVTTGVLALDDAGKLDYDAAVAILAERASPGHQLSRSSDDDTPAMQAVRAAALAAPAEVPSDDENPSNYQQARTLRERFAALNERLRYEKEIGRVVDAEGVDRAAHTAARMLRDHLLAIPSRLAAELAVEADPKAVQEKLTHELRRALDAVQRALQTRAEPADDCADA